MLKGVGSGIETKTKIAVKRNEHRCELIQTNGSLSIFIYVHMVNEGHIDHHSYCRILITCFQLGWSYMNPAAAQIFYCFQKCHIAFLHGRRCMCTHWRVLHYVTHLLFPFSCDEKSNLTRVWTPNFTMLTLIVRFKPPSDVNINQLWLMKSTEDCTIRVYQGQKLERP